ncbi:MAG TPA: pyridoxamine 5'-phosphate oxidase family protein [Pirellulales bacterium]|nr:pyridoxamine 5'-phosphate oxidase family protein [Pirellulales bacterium]
MPDIQPTERTAVKRLPQRACYDREAIHRILDEGMICHVGFAVEGQPFVIPTIYVRIGESIYLHGSPASRMLQALKQGVEASVAVTLVDGLVLARSAFHHSMNYRSVVLFGKGSAVDDETRKFEILRCLTDHLIRGRFAEIRVPSPEELKRTLVVAIAIDEVSAKVRTGPPLDDEPDYALPVWAGVLPLRMAALPPVADPRLPPEIAAPSYAIDYGGPGAAIENT